MLKVLLAASEAAPFIKTGGLADVAGSLPKELLKKGADVRVIIPKYSAIPDKYKDSMKYIGYTFVKLGWRNQYCGVFECVHEGITFYFIDNEYYFNREKIYGHYDEAEMFGFFCKAVLESLQVTGFQPDIIHCNDWHTGYIPALARINHGWDKYFNKIKFVYTIHNLQYQGIFPSGVLGEILDIGYENFTADKLEFKGNVNFMKAGIVYSDLITTVSPSYAEEVKMHHYGEGLEGLLNARKDDLHGILNGLDYDEYNPETDRYIYKNYNIDNFKNKAFNKRSLQNELGLPVKADVPVMSLISRLVPQKGIELLEHVIEEIAAMDMQFIILGTGDSKYEELFRHMEWKYPEKISANMMFNNQLSHRIYAGSDMFLMPSKFEPCGLSQLISLRYGTIPIVRETGGLKDTVKPFNDLTNEGNGFSFANYNAHDMLYTIQRAERFFQDKKIWHMLVKRSMEMDNSWGKSAEKYMELYEKLV
ncbi:MAG: glycogen/starch synthase, ADP-glucose type [Firmicutes bacterium]|nr:glycogen/starch synthase, ADP-glucose type [Bacillota bacterium]